MIPTQLCWKKHSYIFHWIFFMAIVFLVVLQRLGLLPARRGWYFPPYVLYCCHLDWMLLFRIKAARQPGLLHFHTLFRLASDLPYGFLQRSGNTFSSLESCVLSLFYGRLALVQTSLRDDQRWRKEETKRGQHPELVLALQKSKVALVEIPNSGIWTGYLRMALLSAVFHETRLLCTWCCYSVVVWWEVFHTTSLKTQAAQGWWTSLPPLWALGSKLKEVCLGSRNCSILHVWAHVWARARTGDCEPST